MQISNTCISCEQIAHRQYQISQELLLRYLNKSHFMLLDMLQHIAFHLQSIHKAPQHSALSKSRQDAPIESPFHEITSPLSRYIMQIRTCISLGICRMFFAFRIRVCSCVAVASLARDCILRSILLSVQDCLIETLGDAKHRIQHDKNGVFVSLQSHHKKIFRKSRKFFVLVDGNATSVFQSQTRLRCRLNPLPQLSALWSDPS